MRNIVRIMALVLAGASIGDKAAATVGEAPASENMQTPARSGPPVSGAAAETSAAELLRAGDTIKVAIYELIDVDADAQAQGPGMAPTGVPASLKSYFQRMDLSGDYEVQQDGSIMLPRIGSISSSGRSLHDVREAIQSSFASTMGTPAEVNVTITKRQPVYVVGAVKNSGAYQYVAGMMVIQAISLAGGIERSPAHSAQIIDQVRGAEKLDQTRDRLKRLLVKKARLEADRDGAAQPAVTSRLQELAGVPDAERLIAAEAEILEATRRARAAQLDDLDTQITSTQQQLALLKQRGTQFDAQMQARTSRLDQLQALQQRGGVVQTSLITAQTDLSDITGRKQDFEITLAQTEQRLTTARSTRAKLETDEKLALSKDLADTVAEIADAERALGADALAMRTLTAMAVQEGAADIHAVPLLEIIRRTGTTRSTISADDTTELMPGDVVRVRLKSSRGFPGEGTRYP